MQTLPYETYAELMDEFSWGEAWDMVDGDPQSVNIAEECIDRHQGDAVRIKFEDGTTKVLAFEWLADQTAAFANLLEEYGVEKGDRVAIMLNPSAEFHVSFFGTIKRGAVAVPCSELFGPDALEYRLKRSEPELLVTNREIADNIDAAEVAHFLPQEELLDTLERYETEFEPNTVGEDDLWVQYTSGTTGRPTPHVYQHKSVVYYAPVMDMVYNWKEGDNGFTTSSTGWGAGIWIGLMGPLVCGVPTGFLSGPFDPKRVLDALDEFEVNALLGVVPTAYRKLLNAYPEHDQSVTVEKASYGGEPMDPKLSREISRVLGAFPQSYYGATEVGSQITIDYGYLDYEFRHGSLGKPLPRVEVAILDEVNNPLSPGNIGSIAIRRSEDWIVTEDTGYMDEDGYFWSAGRKDDTIISAGYTIGPQEIEDTLRSHPAVEEAGVIGMPDEERGQIVKAFVQPANSPGKDLERELREFVKDNLSKHEYPRLIEFIDDVPTTTGGKIKREQLREREGIVNKD